MEVKTITDAGIAMMATHNLSLVILSVVIAIIASYTALDLSGRVTVAQGRVRTALWLAGGAIAMGIGIWSMHFIAMLAYNLPIPIAYNLPIVLVSIAVAVVASGAALFVVSRQKMGGLQLLTGGVFMGLAIAAMHYTGMAAMQLEATPLYDPNLVALSILIAISASLLALRLAFDLRTQTTRLGCVRKLGSALVMGNAIAGTHYTAMAAVSFQPTNQVVQPSHAMDNSLLGVGIGIATVVILTLALIASIFEQRISVETAKAEALRQSEERFRCLVQNTSDIIAVVGADGTVCYKSASVKRILGYEAENWQKAFEFVHPDDLAKAENVLTKALSCPALNIAAEFRLRHADGQVRDFEVIVNNLLAEPSVAGIVTTYRDITERKWAESARRKAYDELEIRVEQRTTELRLAVEQLLVEISERKRAESRLQAAFTSQRNFINDASHELRTPIAIIRCYIELLGIDSQEQPETLAIVIDELDRMTRIVNDLLLLCKAEQPDFLNLELVEISSLTESLYVKANALAARNWCLEAKGSGCIIADRQRITQAVLNFAQNATQHTTESDVIALGSTLTDGSARFWVRDTGSGIATADLERIFKRFARGSSGRRSEGAGLGLAIVQAIALAHGGWVELCSQPGSGSTFTIVIPLEPSHKIRSDETLSPGLTRTVVRLPD